MKDNIIESKHLTRLGYNECITCIDFIVTLNVPIYITFIHMIQVK